MRLNLNTSGAHAARQLNATVKHLEGSVGRLSSGDRIASATDDAAGLVISNRLRAQVSGLRQAMRNAQEGLAATQIQDDALMQVTDVLLRMRDLAVKAANTAIYDTAAKSVLQQELSQLEAEGRRALDTTAYGTINLTRSTTNPMTLSIIHVGAGPSTAERITFPIAAVEWDFTSWSAAPGSWNPSSTISEIDTRLHEVSATQRDVAALGVQFESVVASLQTTSDNVAVGESRIRDVDMAAEMVGYTKHQVMRDASSAMLAQASRIHENLLGLLAA